MFIFLFFYFYVDASELCHGKVIYKVSTALGEMSFYVQATNKFFPFVVNIFASVIYHKKSFQFHCRTEEEVSVRDLLFPRVKYETHPHERIF